MTMALVLGFLSTLLATFGLVIALTRRSPEEQTIARRMALIRQAQRKAGLAAETGELLKAKRSSRFAWLDESVQRFRWARLVEIRIVQANSTSTVATLIVSSLGLLMLGYGVAWLCVPMVVIDSAAGLGLSLLPYGILSLRRTRRMDAFDDALPESIDMMSRALRAGHSVLGAMEMLAEHAQEPARSEFGEVFKQQNLGLPMRDALLQLLDRVPSTDLRVLVTAILVQRDTGGNLVEILDRTAFVIRERLRIQGEIRIQTAQGRLTGWILNSLPLIMMVLLNVVNPGYSRILLTDPLGRKLIYLGIAMLAVGTFLIRRIVNGIEV